MDNQGRCETGTLFDFSAAPSNQYKGVGLNCLVRDGQDLVLEIRQSNFTFTGNSWVVGSTDDTAVEAAVASGEYQFEAGYHDGLLHVAFANRTETVVVDLFGNVVARGVLPNQATLIDTHKLGFKNLGIGPTGSAELFFANKNDSRVYTMEDSNFVPQAQKETRLVHVDDNDGDDILVLEERPDGLRHRIIPARAVAATSDYAYSQSYLTDFGVDYSNSRVWPEQINKRVEAEVASNGGGYLFSTDGHAFVVELSSTGFWRA